MGDTVLNLVKKGLAVPEVGYEGSYLLTDNTFAGIAFKCQAKIRHKDGRVNSLSYISDSYADQDAFQADLAKFFKYMSDRPYKMIRSCLKRNHRNINGNLLQRPSFSPHPSMSMLQDGEVTPIP